MTLDFLQRSTDHHQRLAASHCCPDVQPCLPTSRKRLVVRWQAPASQDKSLASWGHACKAIYMHTKSRNAVEIIKVDIEGKLAPSQRN